MHAALRHNSSEYPQLAAGRSTAAQEAKRGRLCTEPLHWCPRMSFSVVEDKATNKSGFGHLRNRYDTTV
jgi:hypothetical protein